MDCPHEEYEILKQRGRELTVKCLECNEIFKIIKEKEKDITVPVIINRRENSVKSRASVKERATLNVGDVLDVNGETVEIHSIEVGNKRVESMEASKIDSIWGISLSYPMVIGVSVHIPNKTLSFKVKVERDGLFRIGDVLQIGKTTFEVTSMITTRGKRQSAYGDEIKRIYGKPSKGLAIQLLEAYDGS